MTPNKISYKGQIYRLVEGKQLNEEWLENVINEKFPGRYTIDAIYRLQYKTPEIEFDEEKVKNAIANFRQATEDTYKVLYEEIIKPEQTKEIEAEKARKQATGLIIDLTQEQADLIDVVLGQLSDGYWENQSYYDWIWKNCDVEGTKLIIDKDKMRREKGYSKRADIDYELLSNEDTAKAWFAKKAQVVQNEDLKYHFGTTRLAGHEDEQANYLDRGVNQTFRQIQDAIDSMR